MGYKAAMHVLEFAKKYNMLDNGFVKDMIQVISLKDDPDLVQVVEDIIQLDSGHLPKRFLYRR